MDQAALFLTIGGGFFTVVAVAGGVWQMRREARRRRGVAQDRWGGDPAAVVAAAGPDERDVLRRIRTTQGDEAAAIRLRRVDRDLPFDVLLTAVRTLD